MATEGVENFQAILVSLAAAAGSIVAGLSLWTWKQQIRWQQGRGLAVSTLQAFFAFKRTALDTMKLGFFPIDETQSEEQRNSSSMDAWTRAKDHSAKLEEVHITLEKQVAEAMVVWGDDFGSFMNEILDVKHIASSSVLTGAASIDTRRSRRERAQSASLHDAFQSDVYGYNDSREGLANRLSTAQNLLLEILHSKRLA